MTLTSNILIIGKTGVGKSTFLNYIYGENIAKTGTGRPVTGYGLDLYEYVDRNIVYSIYDTWGLEADKAEKWEQLILDEVNTRDESMEIRDWFHTIYYCFSAATARVEEFEIEHILKPLIHSGNRVTIIFTHADVPQADDKIAEMRRVLYERVGTNLSMIHVSSEKKVLLGGKVVEPFGKEEVWSHIRLNLWDDLKEKLPVRFETYIESELNRWSKDSLEHIDRHKLWNSSHHLKNKLNNELNRLMNEIFNVLEKTLADAVYYYFNLMGHVLHVDQRVIDDILHDIKHKLSHSRDQVDKKSIIKTILFKSPLVETIKYVINHYHSKKSLTMQMHAHLNYFKKEVIPQVIKLYKEQLNTVDDQLLLMSPKSTS